MSRSLRLHHPEPRARLPFTAARVLKACKHPRLTWPVKAVWLELYALHNGPDGAYIGAGPLAARLGLSREGVERARRELKALGLLWDLKTPERRTASWFPMLPEGVIPAGERPKDPEILDASGRLAMLLGPAHGDTPVDSGQPAHGETPVARRPAYGGTPVSMAALLQTGASPYASAPQTGASPSPDPDPTGVSPYATLDETGVPPCAPEDPASPTQGSQILQPQEAGGSHEPRERLDGQGSSWREEFRRVAAERELTHG